MIEIVNELKRLTKHKDIDGDINSFKLPKKVGDMLNALWIKKQTNLFGTTEFSGNTCKMNLQRSADPETFDFKSLNIDKRINLNTDKTGFA